MTRKISPKVQAVCRYCGKETLISVRALAKNYPICQECIRIRSKQDYDRRKANGLPVSGTRMPRSYHRAYEAKYYQRPEVKARRAEQFQRRMEDPQEQFKYAARKAVRNAIRRGDIKRQPCEVCGAIRVQAHHDDYSRPLDVRWLCPVHHAEHHAKARGETP